MRSLESPSNVGPVKTRRPWVGKKAGSKPADSNLGAALRSDGRRWASTRVGQVRSRNATVEDAPARSRRAHGGKCRLDPRRRAMPIVPIYVAPAQFNDPA